MKKIEFWICLLFLISGCRNNNAIEFENFQALRCRSNTKEKINIYIFNKNSGYLYFYDKTSKKFVPNSERFEVGTFTGNTSETFSTINKNNLLITNIEYNDNLNQNQNYTKTQDIINLKSLIKRTIYKNKKGNYVVSKEKCIWIDPKLVIKL